MNRKILYDLLVLVIYLILVPIFIYFANNLRDCVHTGSCVNFCDTVKSSDDFIRTNFKFNDNRRFEEFQITKGTPKCIGGVRNVGNFSEDLTNPFEIVRFY